MCGSCWAFAAASQIASYAKLNDMSHPLEEISVQHLVRFSYQSFIEKFKKNVENLVILI